MKISVERWSKFKQELLTIIFISTLHIWWCFNFPAYIRLGFPWNTMLSVAMSIFGIVAYVIIFSSPQKFVSCLKFDPIDESLFFGLIIKKIMRVWILVVYHISILIIWYKDFYRMPSIYYMLLYIYYLTFFILLFRAAYRQPNDEQGL